MPKSILDIWHDKAKIFEGFMNTLFKKEDVEIIAAERMKICNECPHIDLEGSKCFPGVAPPCCGVCSCKLSWKVRSLSEECPDPDGARWEAVLSAEEEIEVNTKIGFDP